MKLLRSPSGARAAGASSAGRQQRQAPARPSLLPLSRSTSSPWALCSHNGRLELALGSGAATDVQAAAAEAADGLEPAFDIIGLAQVG